MDKGVPRPHRPGLGGGWGSDVAPFIVFLWGPGGLQMLVGDLVPD